jgi:tetratricopeptide (TPR) repeat protein
LVHEALGEQTSAREAWQSGIAAVRESEYHRASDSLLYVSLIQSHMKAGEEVGELLREARDLFPRNAQFVWLEGHALMNEERFDEAVMAFQRMLGSREKNDADQNVGYDERLFGIYTYSPLATCLFRLQRYGEARYYYELAEQAEPGTQEYRIKRRLCVSLEKSQTAQS